MRRFKRMAAMLLTAAGLCGLLGGTASAADSKEEKQRAIVETAIAYYLNGKDQQYDSMPLSEGYTRDEGGNIRHAHYFSPEDATPDQTTFSVCSEYCFEVLYNALGYKLHGDPRRSVTKNLQNEVKGPIVVFRFDNRKVSEAEADAAAERAWKLLQPGDIVVDCTQTSETNGGHAMLFVGDIDDDGEADILHSSGKKYDMKTGVEQYEKKGTVKKASAEKYFHQKGKGRYFGQRGRDTILRVVDDPDQPSAITPSARTRMQYPWMRCIHTVDTGCYGAAELGGELIYTLRIQNKGKQDFKSVPVRYVVPEGTELLAAPDAQIDGRTLTWTLDVPAGETKKLTVNVKVTAALGAEIVSDGGMVGEIPMKVLTTVVGGSRAGLDALKNLDAINQKLVRASSLRGAAMANAIYRYGMGVETEIPDMAELFDILCTKADIPGHELYTLRDNYRETAVGKMVVRHWIGGRRYTAKDTKERVQETRLKDLQCGDLIMVSEVPVREITATAYYYDGTDLIALKSGKLVREDPIEVEKLLSKPFFVALRPTQAFENLRTRTEATLNRFRDVKRADWFFRYVDELAADGTISGVTEKEFQPNGTLTCGQALKLIAKAVGKPEQAKTGTHWASGYLTLAQNEGWLDGDAELDRAITRLELCRIAARAKKLLGKGGFHPFTDTDDPAVTALYQKNVVGGVTATEFRPNDSLTRAQMAKIIWTLRTV